MASCYMHLPVLHEDTDDGKYPLSPLPAGGAPEPYYLQPFAERAAAVVKDQKLDFITPMHSHAHDYLLSLDDAFPVIGGEAQSSPNFAEERNKMLLGVLQILNVYDMAICMASGNNQCEIGFYKLGIEQGVAGISYPAIMGKHWTIMRPNAEDRYVGFIMDVIEGLECTLGVWLKECSF